MQDCNSSDFYVQICKGQISFEWVIYQLYESPMPIFDKNVINVVVAFFVKISNCFWCFAKPVVFIINLYALC